MTIKIKNMVSQRCIMAVQTVLCGMKIEYNNISLGEIDLKDELSKIQREQLAKKLYISGLELIYDKRLLIIEKIQNAIIEMFDLCQEKIGKLNYTQYISARLNSKYSYLALLFSQVKGITLQQFIIQFKIDKVKALLIEGVRPVDISYQLGYSSIAHLSGQFKKTTGYTLSVYRSSISK